MYIMNHYHQESSCLLSSLLSKPPPTSPIPSNTNLSTTIPIPIDPDLLTTLNNSNSPTTCTKKINRLSTQNNSIRSKEIDWKLIGESKSLVLSQDSRSACLHAQCSSCFETDGVRADTPIRSNCTTTFEWHVSASTTSGTSCMFGVCTESARLHSSNGYMDLFGGDSQSLALSSRGRIHYNGYSWPYCEPFDDGREHIVKCVVNMISGSIQFCVDGRVMGGRETLGGMTVVYACTASTTSRSIIRLASVHETYATLKEMCVEKIQADSSGSLIWTGLNEYRLPMSILTN